MASPTLERTAKEQEARRITGLDRTDDKDSPAYECASYKDQIVDVRMMRAVYGGTKTMRERGTEFLPVHPMERDAKYKDRLNMAVAFNALQRTVTGLTGMVFRRDLVLSDDMDAGVVAATEDIDRSGHKLPVFMHRTAQNALLDGHTWVHVEAPRRGLVQTRGQERSMGVRPYWINVTKSQAINWRYDLRDGEAVLTLFVYRTGGTEPDGPFGERQADQIRVLRETAPGEIEGELWQYEERTDDSPAEWRQLETYPIDAERVPVVFLPSNEVGHFMSDPPLRDLAYEQIERYRVRSDRQKSLTFSAISVPWVFGKEVTDQEGNSKVRWSADTMMLLNDPEASAGMLESAGNGLDALAAELAAIDATMASLGLQMLVRPSGPQPSASDITATSDVMRRSESEAALVLFADAIETAANECLKLHVGYSAKAPEPGTVTINRDFHDKMLDPQRAKVLHEMVVSGDLSQETFWTMLVAGELLDESFDPAEERARIAREAASRMDALERVMDDGTDTEDAGDTTDEADDDMGEAA